MSAAEDLLKSGDLDGALEALQGQVRKDPSDVKLRIFLFQLLCVLGNWPRALTQLKVCGEMDPAALPMVQTYREAIACEVYREKVFAGELQPLVFGKPSRWVALMLEGVKSLAAGQSAAAADLRAEAFEEAPATSGELNGEAFEWISDADTRLGPVLEAIVNGRYYWLPFDAISEVTGEEPTDLRDQVWTPVQFTFANGGQTVGLIPTRYPGAADQDDPKLRLARLTDWRDLGDECFAGLGQRILATDAAETPLQELRTLSLDVEAPETDDGDAPAADQDDG